MRFPGGSLSGSDMHRRRAVTVRTAGGFWKITPVVKETGVVSPEGSQLMVARPTTAQCAPSGHPGFVDIF